MVPDLGGSQSRLTWQWCESVWEERKCYGERGVGRWNERKERYWGGVGGLSMNVLPALPGVRCRVSWVSSLGGRGCWPITSTFSWWVRGASHPLVPRQLR